MNPKIIPIDLEFQGIKGAIASYLIPYDDKAVLVECGPGSTQNTFIKKLADYNLTPKDITHVLLTHIHLDHAGAAGWLANQGAKVFVHHIGAPHLINPERLLRSAKRIYGDQMDMLWGEFLPVPPEQIHSLTDKDKITIGDLQFIAIDSPGHANHHMAYLLDNICFCGDVGGVRMDFERKKQLRLPTPPPEFDLLKWYQTIDTLASLPLEYIALTHFGIFSDPRWHFKEIKRRLSQLQDFLMGMTKRKPTQEEFRKYYEQWLLNDYKQDDIEPKWVIPLTAVNPTDMSADGLFRYWSKHTA